MKSVNEISFVSQPPLQDSYRAAFVYVHVVEYLIKVELLTQELTTQLEGQSIIAYSSSKRLGLT